MGEMADLFEMYDDFEEYDRDVEREPVEYGFMPVEGTLCACEVLEQNMRLIIQNKDLLARCDLLEAEIAELRQEIDVILGELT